jgi:hypothetical protein
MQQFASFMQANNPVLYAACAVPYCVFAPLRCSLLLVTLIMSVFLRTVQYRHKKSLWLFYCYFQEEKGDIAYSSAPSLLLMGGGSVTVIVSPTYHTS